MSGYRRALRWVAPTLCPLRARLERMRVRRPWLATFLPALLLFVVSALLRAPFVPRTLVNWDSVQFALATRAFDIERHQPHPPGYILYVGWGRLLTWLLGDANWAFALTSVVAGSLAVALLYVLGRQMVGGRTALVAAALFATSPLVWYYSVVALTYAVEAFFLLIVACLCWRALQLGEGRPVIWAAVALGLAGGVRQSTLVLLLPLWLVVAVRTGRRTFVLGLTVLAGTCLLWLVPLVYLAGGPRRYVQAGASLLGFVGEKTSVLYGGVQAVLGNLAQVGAGLVLGLNLSLLAVGLALVMCRGGRRQLARREWLLLGLWAGPALATFVFGHIGQVGYLLLVLPALCLVVAVYVEALSQRLTGPLRLTPGRATTLLVGVLATAQLATIAAAPSTAHALLGDPVTASMVDVRDNDRFWREVPEFVGRYAPEEAIVIAEASPWGSFRHAGYYLTSYRVYGVGNDRYGHFGYLYESYRGSTDYSLEERARRSLPRPYDARYAIILDPKIARTLAQQEALVEVVATPYRSFYVLDLQQVDMLTFSYGRTFLHGPALASRDAIPWTIRDLRLDDGQ